MLVCPLHGPMHKTRGLNTSCENLFDLRDTLARSASACPLYQWEEAKPRRTAPLPQVTQQANPEAGRGDSQA